MTVQSKEKNKSYNSLSQSSLINKHSRVHENTQTTQKS